MNKCTYTDCKYSEYNGLVCQLCCNGDNFFPIKNSGILHIDMHQYKYLLRGREWVMMFAACRVQTAISNIVINRYLSADLANDPKYQSVVYTRCMTHQNQVHKEQTMVEELDYCDSYYAMEYRDILYLMHKDRKQVYVKAILNWEGKVNAVQK